MRHARTLLCASVIAASGACASTPEFSIQNARGHVVVLAREIGSRPAGTEANDRARAYLVNHLRSLGFDVRVQAADARRPEAGLTARVHNIIAVREGRERDAIALVAHYDSVPYGPGAADDGLGAAVTVEAARALVATRAPAHTLAVILTDAEELGLMGAAAIASDPVAARIRVYLNFEAIGSDAAVMLFETGPGNAWAVRAWANAASEPRGTSVGYEIYRRLPNDTDFSILKRLGAPGLNFASIGDGYAYHTPRDTADRLTDAALAEAGAAAVRTVRALDGRDIATRTFDQATYYDIAGVRAFSYGPAANAIVAWLALALGLVAWIRCTRVAAQAIGRWRLLLTALWSVVAAALVLASMIAVTWAVRAAREFYHPWYAHPNRLFILLALVGTLMAWSMARAGALVPMRYRGARHPAAAWAIALPFWMVLAGVSAAFAPGASYLWTVPLAASGLLLGMTPLRRTAVVRGVSVLAFVVGALVWGSLLLQFLPFMVTNFGRMPLVTPVWAYAVVIFAGAMMMAPPAISALTGRPLRMPGWTTATLLALIAVAAGLTYAAPAYTHDQPRHRHVRYLQDTTGARAVWEVAGTEPGLDLFQNSLRWEHVHDAPQVYLPFGPLPHPFVFRALDAPASSLPARVTLSRGALSAGTVEFTVSVTPAGRALAATFVMPPDVVPIRPTLAGIIRRGRWIARYAAVPPEGVTLRGYVNARDGSRLDDVRVLVSSSRLPGGTGAQGLPAWLPQEDTVWTSDATFIMSPIAEVVGVPESRPMH